MSLESKRSPEEARAESIRETVRGYADDVGAFARDLARAQVEMGASHVAGGKECNCGLCGAVANANMDEVLASAHLIGGQECGCARCAALSALAEGYCPGPDNTTLGNIPELQKMVDGQDGGGAP